jgi:hypothetical protein
VPATVRPDPGRRALAVVGHLDHDLASPKGQAHHGGGSAGVARHVGQRLLHDPVGGQVHRQRQLDPPTLDRHLDPPAGPSRPGHQPIQLGQAGQRRPRPALLAELAQHAKGRPQLLQRLAARLLDRQQRRTGLPRPPVQHVHGHAGLEVDHRDAVGHHVMQLPGQPQPLLVDAAANLLGGALAADPHRPPQPQRRQKLHRPDRHDPREFAQHRLPVGDGDVGGDDHGQGGGDHGEDDRRAPVGSGRQRVDGNPHGQEDRAVRVAQRQVGDGRRHRQRQHRDRAAPPGHQRHRPEQDQPVRHGVQRPPVRLVPGRSDRAGHPEHGHAHDQQPVDDPRRTQQAPAENLAHLHRRTIRPSTAGVVNSTTYPPSTPSGDADPEARASNLNDTNSLKPLVR